MFNNFATRMFMSLVFTDLIMKSTSGTPEDDVFDEVLFDKLMVQISQQEASYF